MATYEKRPLDWQAEYAITLAHTSPERLKFSPFINFHCYPNIIRGSLWHSVEPVYGFEPIWNRDAGMFMSALNATSEERDLNIATPTDASASSPVLAPTAPSSSTDPNDSFKQQLFNFRLINFTRNGTKLTSVALAADPNTSGAPIYGVLESSGTSKGFDFPCMRR